MSNAKNYEDVLRQLECAGFVLDGPLVFSTAKPERCMVDGERTRKGWYSLHQVQFTNNDIMIIGSFGVWHGSERNKQIIELPKGTIKDKSDNKMIRVRMAQDKKKADAAEKSKQRRAAQEALRKWREFSVEGESGYLVRKQVGAFGVRFAEGAVVVPVTDTSGIIHGLQFILDKKNDAHKEKIKKNHGKDKKFWPFGMKIGGHFHLLGKPDPSGVNLAAEGYSTAATLHEATGRCVAVLFNANNVLPALKNLCKYYPRSRWLHCTDDDYLCRCNNCKKQTLVADKICSHCNEEHLKHNTGLKVAINTCAQVDAVDWIKPEFTARDGRKLTDFNDLHVEESIAAVRSQVEDAIAGKFPNLGYVKPVDQARSAARAQSEGGGGLLVYDGLMNAQRACERFSLVYGFKDTLFDHHLNILVPKSCVMDIIEDHAWREWKRDFGRKVVGVDAVGFDPCETDPLITCNLWAGWPTTPSSEGSYEHILELLKYLCSEGGDHKVFDWVLKWIAYPIQHPGAKMRTALVFHGPQGTGKNIIFEDVVMRIYGGYGAIVNQDAVEDRFNDWASAKLFMVADEVVARADLYHLKNKLKGLVTGENIRINPKQVAAHNEKNHVNLVFMSNEYMPLVLDKDDRRYLVVWTPPKLEPDVYKAIGKEIAEGGIAAFHDYLLKLDLGDFNEHTKPIDTAAKDELIQISKDSPDRFIDEWRAGDTQWAYQMCAVSDLFRCYRTWCTAQGENYPLSQNKFSALVNKLDGMRPMRFNIAAEGSTIEKPKSKTIRAYGVDDEMPNGESLIDWRTKRIRRFHNNLVPDPM